jgi:tRNA pseudouridine38-40 synthase
MRMALGIEYDGSGFCGWQMQAGVQTVQQAVEQALSSVANSPVRVACAGRTDTGVHALCQVVHFDTDAIRSERSWVFGANANLPKQVSVLWAKSVSSDFHARFSAQRRRYRYIIFTRPVRPTFLAWRVAWDYRLLDAGKMADAARLLVGEHDFTSYRAQACQAKSPVKTVYELNVAQQDDLILIDVEANGFLHHMVRNIAGVLMTIGAGEQPPGWAQEILLARDRRAGGVTAPPHGLYFLEARYPEHFAIPRLSRTRMVW